MPAAVRAPFQETLLWIVSEGRDRRYIWWIRFEGLLPVMDANRTEAKTSH